MINIEIRLDEDTLLLPTTSYDNIYIENGIKFEEIISSLSTYADEMPVYIKCSYMTTTDNVGIINITNMLDYKSIDYTESDIFIYLNNYLLTFKQDYYFTNKNSIYINAENKKGDMFTIEIVTKVKYLNPKKEIRNVDEKMMINNFILNFNNYVKVLSR